MTSRGSYAFKLIVLRQDGDMIYFYFSEAFFCHITSESSGSTWCTLRFPVSYWWSIAARVESECLRCKSWWKLKIFICPKLKMGREKVLCFQNTSCFLFHLFFFLIGELTQQCQIDLDILIFLVKTEFTYPWDSMKGNLKSCQHRCKPH